MGIFSKASSSILPTIVLWKTDDLTPIRVALREEKIALFSLDYI